MGYVISCRHFLNYDDGILVHYVSLTYCDSLFQVVPEAPQEAPNQTEAKSKTETEKKKNDPPIIDDNALENGKWRYLR